MDNKLISLKQLAQLSEPSDWVREYAATRQRAKRGKYITYQKLNGEGFIEITDPAIPATIQYKLTQVNSPELKNPIVSPPAKIKSDSDNELSPKQLEVALARVDLIKAYLEFANQSNNSAVEAKKRFVEAYKHAFPELYSKLGDTSFKTIERWKKIYKENNQDYRALAPSYKTNRPSSVTPAESSVLIQLFLNPNKPLISETVRQAMDIFIAKRFDNLKSAHTYRRYLEDWKKEHYADYVFFREGEKALDDKVLPFLERDYSMIEVGDIIVADGHVLNFEIINPFTGKPKRMTMVGFFDMKSSMPLGWEITPTEDTQAIAVAFRRSILRLGKYPKICYLDNGRAFSAKFFHGTDLRSAGITGLFERTGTKVITAMPYHAQSKTIERFFRSFAELERLVPTYTGTSIEMKPPRTHRGEKLHNKLYDKFMHGTSIDIYTAHKAVAWWFDKYAERPQQDGHLKGIAPIEIFNTGKGPGVDPKELTYLMLQLEVKTIYRNGIRMFNTSYWNEALFGKEWDDVIIRFDLLEKDSLFVYDQFGEFICEAKRIDKVHPAAGILGTEEDVKQLHDQLARKQSLKNLIVGDAKRFLSDEVYPAAKKQFSEINLIPIVGEEIPVAQETQQKSKPRRKNLLDSWENANIEPKQNRAAEA